MKKPKKHQWNFEEIMDAFGECAHIHMGSPNNNFVEWRDLKDALMALKEGRPYREQPTVRKLHAERDHERP